MQDKNLFTSLSADLAPKLDEEAIAKLDEVLQSTPEGQKILSQGIGTISDPAGAGGDKAVRDMIAYVIKIIITQIMIE